MKLTTTLKKITVSFVTLVFFMTMQPNVTQAAFADDFSTLLATLQQTLTLLLNSSTQVASPIGASVQQEIYLNADSSVTNSAGVDPSWQSGSGAYATGIDGQAFKFDGGDFVKFPHIDAIVGVSNISVMAWAKRDSNNTGTQAILSRHATYWITSAPNKTTFSIITSTGERKNLSVSAPTDNAWHHYALTYDGTQVIGYIDGIAVTSGSTAGDPLNTGNPGASWGFAIGRSSAVGDVFKGLIDEIQVLTTTLSAPAIKSYVDSFNVATSDSTQTQTQTSTQPDDSVTSSELVQTQTTEPETPIATDGDIYVDSRLSADCNGTYSIASRNCGASSGKVAFNTIQEAVDAITSNNTIFVRGGTYRESVDFTNPARDIVIEGYRSERPVLTGLEPLTDLKTCTATICGNNPNWRQMYYTKVPASNVPTIGSFAVVEDKERLSMASYPNQPDSIREDQDLFIPVDASSYGMTSGFNSSALTQSNGYWNGTSIRFWSHGANNWVLSKEVKDFSGGKVTFEEPLKNAVTTGSLPDAYSFVNSLLPEVFDKKGEYAISKTPDSAGNHTVYVWPKSINDLNKLEYITKKVGILIRRSDGLTVNNMDITGFSGDDARSGGVIVATTGSAQNNLTFTNLHVYNIKGANAIGVAANSNVYIDGVLIHDTLPDTRGISVSGRNVVVQNSEVYRLGRTGIYFGNVTDGKMIHNYVHGFTGTHGNGLTVYQDSDNVLIKNNRVVGTGGIHLTLQSSKDIIVTDNIFDGAGKSDVLVTDWGGMTGYLKYINNTIVRSTQNNSFRISDNTDAVTTLKNNIIQGGSSADIQGGNIWTGLMWNQIARYGWELNKDDLLEEDFTKTFANPTQGDFHLRSDSIARDTGVDISGDMPSSLLGENLYEDYDGHPRLQGSGYDIGAYEYSDSILQPKSNDILPVTPEQTPVVTPDISTSEVTPITLNTPVTPNESNVIETTDNVNVRIEPEGEVITVAAKGSKGKRSGGSVRQGSHTWTKVVLDSGTEGYIADTYLKSVTTNSAVNTKASSDRLRTINNLNVRSTPGGSLIQMVPLGTRGTKIASNEVVQGNYHWIKVHFDNGVEGYVANSFVAPEILSAGSTVTPKRRAEILVQIQQLFALVQVLQTQLDAMRAAQQ